MIDKTIRFPAHLSIELFSIVAYYIIAAAGIVHWRLGYTETAFIFWGVPGIYFSIRRPSLIKKTALYSALVIVPLSFVIDYMGHVSHAWYEPTALTGIRILNVFPADIFIWGFFYSYVVVAFYTYVFDRDRGMEKFSPRFHRFVFALLALVLLFAITYIINKQWLIITHFYVVIVAGLFMLPLALILWKFPRLFTKMAFTGTYFAVLSLIFEVTALTVGQWHYLGHHYLGRVELLGVMFPFEEALWILFAVPAYLCIYEFFADDQK